VGETGSISTHAHLCAKKKLQTIGQFVAVSFDLCLKYKKGQQDEENILPLSASQTIDKKNTNKERGLVRLFTQ